jgi:hypothetical protein
VALTVGSAADAEGYFDSFRSNQLNLHKKNKTMKRSSLLLIVLAISLGHAGVFAGDPPANSDRAIAPEATTYQIRNLKHRELLRPKDANGATGTPIVLYPAQAWKCMTWRLQPAGESVFQLKNLFTSKTFCASSDTNAQQQSVTQVPLPKDGSEPPTWQFARLADGSYKITDGKSGKALTAVKGTDDYSIKIVIAPWENLDQQKWELEKIDPKQLTM